MDYLRQVGLGRTRRDALQEVAERAEEAWAAGATEVCMQGGIHPDLAGDYYFRILDAVKARVPDVHVHAFSPMEVVNGTARTGLSIEDFLIKAREARLRQDSTLTGYEAKAYERMSVGMGFKRIGRDRLLMRAERSAEADLGATFEDIAASHAISDDAARWLANLPLGHSGAGSLLLVHGTPDSPFEGPQPDASSARSRGGAGAGGRTGARPCGPPGPDGAFDRHGRRDGGSATRSCRAPRG